MDVIPKIIAKGVPKKCPKCLKKCIAVFRLWKPNGKVEVEFLHDNGSAKMCKIVYLDEPKKKLKPKKKQIIKSK